MAEQNLTQDTEQAIQFLREITRGWDSLPEPAMLELRCLCPDKIRKPDTARYSPDDMGFEMAVEHAAAMNNLGFNVYPVVNPVRKSAPLVRDGKSSGAKDEDIVAAFYYWADADTKEATDAIREFAGPKFTMSVLTGRVPFNRPHVYWRIADGPTFDLDRWTQIQKGIAASLKTDPSVVNPSRIMRLPGLINWPSKEKAQIRGRVPELATIRTEYSDQRSPVKVDQMARLFEGAAKKEPTFDIDADPERRTQSDYLDILRRARTDGEKHTGVRDLSASLAGSGVPQALAEAIIREACPVWDEGVESLIQTAYQKFYTERVLPKPSSEAVEKDSSGIITGLKLQSSGDFLADMTPAVYVVDGVIAERRCLSLTGFAGHGKTTLALHMALQVATGGTFGGMECEKSACLMLAGENPDNVKWQYAAALAAANMTPEEADIHFLPGHFQLSQFMDDLTEKASKIPNLKLIVIDSLQSFFEGENDNSNVEIMDAARRFRQLTELPSGPAVIVIAHPAGKSPDRENIVPRGGSAFSNELDGNLTIWSEPDGTQTLHHTEKFRGAPFEPLNFTMEEREFDHLKDHKGRALRLKISRQQMAIEQANAAHKAEVRDRDALLIIDSNPRVSLRALAENLGVSKSTADRIMKGLKDEKLIKRRAKKWLLTEDGNEVANGE